MGSGEVAGAGCTHHHTVVHVTWSSRRPDRSHHETPPHFPPALPPPNPGLRGPAKAQQEQQEKQRSAEGWQTTAAKFTQSQAERFCKSNNMRAVSLDSRDKEDHFLGLVAKDRQRYFWTGGQVRNGRISWPSGRRYNDVAWSHTGGVKLPQPDNREGDEVCLAVLNNFYADGIRFHDVSCHHKKPVICQA